MCGYKSEGFGDSINRISLIKGDEVYRFNFYEDNIPELLEIFGRYASNIDLSFNWYDAVVLSQKAREISQSAYKSRLDEILDPVLRLNIAVKVEKIVDEEISISGYCRDYIKVFNEVITQCI